MAILIRGTFALHAEEHLGGGLPQPGRVRRHSASRGEGTVRVHIRNAHGATNLCCEAKRKARLLLRPVHVVAFGRFLRVLLSPLYMFLFLAVGVVAVGGAPCVRRTETALMVHAQQYEPFNI